MKRALTGIKTTGSIHIANYLGAIKPAIELQEEYECLYFLADLHSFTTVRNPEELKRDTLDQVAIWIASGLNHKKNLLYRQSDVSHVTELAWYLACHTGVGFMEKAHAYKDACAKNKDVNVGLFYYPILMAADILLFDADVVPVGKDQKQHVEMARDMAGSINAIYGEGILKLPEVKIKEDVMTIPGLDGQKMSKSYNNTIELMLPEKKLRKKIMSLTTDSTGLEEAKSMKDTTFGNFYNLFGTKDQFNDLEKRLNAGGLGWGHAKEELFEIINIQITPLREKYEEIRKDEAFLKEVLANGKNRALEISNKTLNRVRTALGVQI